MDRGEASHRGHRAGKSGIFRFTIEISFKFEVPQPGRGLRQDGSSGSACPTGPEGDGDGDGDGNSDNDGDGDGDGDGDWDWVNDGGSQ